MLARKRMAMNDGDIARIQLYKILHVGCGYGSYSNGRHVHRKPLFLFVCLFVVYAKNVRQILVHASYSCISLISAHSLSVPVCQFSNSLSLSSINLVICMSVLCIFWFCFFFHLSSENKVMPFSIHLFCVLVGSFMDSIFSFLIEYIGFR